MTDPERILDHPPSELARTLLSAGREEAPSRRSLERTLSALGAGAATLGTAGTAGALGAAKATSSLTLLALAKWAGIGAAGGVLVAAAAHGLVRPQKPAVTEPRAHVTNVANAANVQNEPSPRVVTPPAPKSETAPPAVSAEPVRHRTAPAPPPVVETEAPLAAEVVFVDRGRAAFQRGELGSALGLLASYEREFPEPRLLPEVLYLRMEATARRGDSAQASVLAERIVRDYPRSPHAARARALLGRE